MAGPELDKSSDRSPVGRLQKGHRAPAKQDAWVRRQLHQFSVRFRFEAGMGESDQAPCPLLVLSDSPTGFKEDPPFGLAIYFRCEAPREGIQVAAPLRGPTHQVSGDGPDVLGEFCL
jgi:hypothetical protein